MSIQFCVKGNVHNELPEMSKDPFFNPYKFEVYLKTIDDLEPLKQLGLEERIATIHVPNKDTKDGSFFSLTSSDPKIADNSHKALEATIQTASNLGGKIVVIHGDAIDVDTTNYDNNEAAAIQESHEKLAQILSELYNPKVKLALETQQRRVYDTVPNYGISANVTPKDFENIQFLMKGIPLHICFDSEHVYKAAIGELFDNILKEPITNHRFKEIPRNYVYAMDRLYRELIAESLPLTEAYIKEFVDDFLKPPFRNMIAVVHACGCEWKNHCIFEEIENADLFLPKSHIPPAPGVIFHLHNKKILDQINHGAYLKPLNNLKTEIPAVLEFDRTKRIKYPTKSTDSINYTNFEGYAYSFKRLVAISKKCLEEQIY